MTTPKFERDDKVRVKPKVISPFRYGTVLNPSIHGRVIVKLHDPDFPDHPCGRLTFRENDLELA
jgi:hypothetical protein